VAESVEFDGEQANLANRIQAVDSRLGVLAEQERESVAQGLKGGGMGVAAQAANHAQSTIDAERQKLLDERQELVDELRSSVRHRQ
jgi:hypothetical protein